MSIRRFSSHIHRLDASFLMQHLESARQASPLFDMPGFVKDFEQAIRSVARPEA